MKNVVMYLKPTCPYCQQAHELLEKKGVHYLPINIMRQPEKREEMILKSGGRTTVPQIFIGDTHVGGYDDLRQLDDDGKLDEMLQE